ncbi:hypothetical protein MMC22_002660 [Lobaria immixta]|nr:hypothetical protein [Lobaria immixta]
MDRKRVRSSTPHSPDTDSPDEDQHQGLNAFIKARDEERRQITIGFIEACVQLSPLPTPPTGTTPQPASMPPPPPPNCSASAASAAPNHTPASMPSPRATPVNDNVALQAQKQLIATIMEDEKAGSCAGDCSSQSCDGGCSMVHCQPGCIPACDMPSCDVPSCDGSQPCDAFEACTSFECTDSPTCLDDSCPFNPFGHVPAFGNDFSNSSADTGADDPVTCLWVMPGQQCNVSVTTVESLGQHVFHEHIEPQGTFTCPIDQCDEKLDAQQAPSHLMREHNPDSYVCLWEKCGQTFPDSTELDRHMKIAHASLDCRWAGCEVSTKEVSQLKNHVDVDHLHFPGVFQPPMSPYTFQSPIYTGQHPAPHISTHSPYTSSHASSVSFEPKPFLQGSIISPYQNPLPSPMSSDQRAFQNDAILPYPTHIKNPLVEGEEGSTCRWITDRSIGQVCGLTFNDGNELQSHVDREHVQSNEGNTTGTVLLCRWLDCKRDGKPLQNKEKLKRHLFTHTGYWIAVCPHCSKQFNNTVALDNHVRVHTGEKPFACKDCEQCFATEAALTIHKRHHTGEKPLVCPVCSYASADSSNMAKHKKTHEPHEHFCPICHKGFSRSGTLERHKKVHDPNRPQRRKRAHSKISS